MAFTSPRERRLWGMAGLCLLLIYSTLYIARPITELLRQHNLLRLAVALAFAATGGAILLGIRRTRPGRRVLVALGVVAVAYVALLWRIPLPEERLHFLEYGLVCAFAHAALCERRRNRLQIRQLSPVLAITTSPRLVAFLLTAAAGWLDEGVQFFLPNRYYDLRDVLFNAAAGAVYLLAEALVASARRAEEGRCRSS